MPATALMQVRGLTRHFGGTRQVPFAPASPVVRALNEVSFSVNQGEVVAVVGESGCGKSTTAKLILRLDEPTAGAVFYKGRDLFAMDGAELRAYRRKVQPVFQDPYSSLNPRLTVRRLVGEPLEIAGGMGRDERARRVAAVLQAVGLPADSIDRYPHEFSGGQRQRIAIARALVMEPELLILDEPVSALDVSIRAQIVNLLQDIRERRNLSYLLISHDLDLVLNVSDRVVVMYLGRIVETARTSDLSRRKAHPYTRLLFDAKLPAHPRDRKTFAATFAELPSPVNLPPGCAFQSRCPQATDTCRNTAPIDISVAKDHVVACHLFAQ